MMRLRYKGDFEMTVRHRTFAPGAVTAFDMDDEKDALLAVKCAGITAFFEPAEDDTPEPPKRRGRPRKVKADGENEA